MRLATELVPAVSAIITPRLFSPFWVVIFYFTMIVFGLAQQMALFHTVSSGLIAIKSDYFLQFESSLIFISCLLGLIFCFPLATEVIYSCYSCNGLLSYSSNCKVHIFWEGHKILWNLHLTFDYSTYSQKLGEDFAKFCGLLRIYEL